MLYGEWIIEGLGLHFSKIKWGWRAKLLGKHTLSKSSTGKIWDALSVVEDLMWKIDIYAMFVEFYQKNYIPLCEIAKVSLQRNYLKCESRKSIP